MNYPSNRLLTHIILRGAFIALPFGLLAAPPKHAPDLLQISVHARMANEGVLDGASGKTDLHLDQHGHDNHQDLHLHLQGLDATASYTLAAQVDDNSNITEVLTFTPDVHGNADIHLREKGPKHPHDHTGHIDGQLPVELEPLTLVRQLLISDTNSATVLSADITRPQDFDYHVKRDLSTNDIEVKLDLHANRHEAKIHVDGKGLEAGAQYSLAINGSVVISATAHDDGHLDLHGNLHNPLDIFAVSSVDVLDADSNVIVSISIP